MTMTKPNCKTGCVCPAAGFCARHQVEKNETMWRNCRENPPYFERWDAKAAAEKKQQARDAKPAKQFDEYRTAVDASIPVKETGPVRGVLVDRQNRNSDFMQHNWLNQSVFLLCGGPSLREMDLSKLENRGVMVASINNTGAISVRPQLWFSYDHPPNFHESIWRDPGIYKFTQQGHLGKKIRTRNEQAGRYELTELRANKCPNVWGYRGKYGFDPEKYLVSSPISYGGVHRWADGRKRDTKNVMMPTLRLLYWLGFRKVFLLGCDFWMRPEKGRTYAFDEQKGKESCGVNNNTYLILNKWFSQLVPYFDEYGFHVYNCTPGGNLTAFPRRDFHAEVDKVLDAFPKVTTLRGMYT